MAMARRQWTGVGVDEGVGGAGSKVPLIVSCVISAILMGVIVEDLLGWDGLGKGARRDEG